MALACGGTTGEPPLALPAGLDASGADASLGDVGLEGAGPDATTGEEGGGSIYTNTFDVAIQYTDRDLPEIQSVAGPEAGAEAGFPWPSCPAFLAVNGAGVVPLGSTAWNLGAVADEVPADWTSDGGSTLAAEGGACATYGWFGTTAIDDCLTTQSNTAQENYPYFPPCNWCPAGSGAVGQGPYAGEQRDFVCLSLYGCMMKSRCYAGGSGVIACLCGSESPTACNNDPHPPGPCADLELSALEVTNAQGVLQSFTSSGPVGMSGSTCGSVLNYTVAQGILDGCFPPAPGDL